MEALMGMQCHHCGGSGVNANGSCQSCGMKLGKEGLEVTGSNYLQVLAVSGALIVLLFGLLMAWKHLSA
jgi:hypothetical protein